MDASLTNPAISASLAWMVGFRRLAEVPGLTARHHADLNRGADLTMMAEVESPLSLAQVQALSPVALAYIGDAVYELFIRGVLLLPPKRIQEYHRQVVSQVRAECQAHYVEHLTPLLTAAEQDLLRRGRNAACRGPKRLDGAIYQQATGFETLIGYLYLTDPHRLMELLGHLPLGPAGE